MTTTGRGAWRGAMASAALALLCAGCTGASQPPVRDPVEPPPAPLDTSAVATSPRAIEVTWSATSDGASTILLERSLAPEAGFVQIHTLGAEALSAVDQPLEPGTTYFYRVRASNAAGPSGYSNVASATTAAPAATAPAAPDGLAAVALSAAAIDVTWRDRSSDETGFKVERSPGGPAGFVQVGTVGAGTTVFHDAGLAAATTYAYRVRATNAAGDSAYTATATATSQAAAASPPAAPTAVAAAPLSSSAVRVTWTDASTDETAFTIERGAAGAGPFAAIGSARAGATSFVDTTCAAGTAYRYRVLATNASGASAPSDVAAASTPSGGAQADVGSALATLAGRSVFFGHASVGGQLMTGLDRLLAANAGAAPRRLGTTSAAQVHAGIFAEHYFVADNGFPVEKMDEFRDALLAGAGAGRLGDVVDVAVMKLCYADFFDAVGFFASGGTAAGLFARYQAHVQALEAAFPRLSLVHVTAPLYVDTATNARREAYNDLIRSTYPASRVFDLALIESTDPSGHAVTGAGGVRALYPGYSLDGGHLTPEAVDLVTRRLVLFLAGL